MRPALLVLLALLVPGCASPLAQPDAREEDALGALRCQHPWPCGDEWPAQLTGPFDVEAEPVAIEMRDGVVLAGWVHLPQLPDGVRAPVVVYATPYMNACKHPIQTDEPECDPDGDDLAGQSPTLHEQLDQLAPRGFALLLVSVRGTGLSGGCFDLWGPTEADDMAEVVEWAAAQAWSNGRVGMYGVSYMGTTPFEAAVRAPPALKTIVVGGVITDVYQTQFTTQGAPLLFGAVTHFEGGFAGVVTAAPPVASPQGLPAFLAQAPERACEETARHQTSFDAGSLGLDRDASYFGARNHALGLPQVTASILDAQGLHEGSVHGPQDDVVWAATPLAPKRFLLGQWGHQLPDEEHLAEYAHAATWMDVAGPWLDFWLKGVGDPPRVGVVDVQTQDGAWRETTAWPPPEARASASFLTADGFADAPGDDALRFRPLPQESTPTCADGGDEVVVATPPLEEDLVLVGNPFGLLSIESASPSGIVGLALLDLEGEGCAATATLLTRGGIDLRFHAGSYAGEDFPVGTPTPVRVDMWGIAHVVPAGHRLALAVYGPGSSIGLPGPEIALHPESHLVLPVLSGDVAGGAPLAEYPPRPFAPPGVG